MIIKNNTSDTININIYDLIYDEYLRTKYVVVLKKKNEKQFLNDEDYERHKKICDKYKLMNEIKVLSKQGFITIVKK